MRPINDSQIREYADNGAICIRQAVDASWIDPMLENIEGKKDNRDFGQQLFTHAFATDPAFQLRERKHVAINR